jgi:hypothetical protein
LVFTGEELAKEGGREGGRRVMYNATFIFIGLDGWRWLVPGFAFWSRI